MNNLKYSDGQDGGGFAQKIAQKKFTWIALIIVIIAIVIDIVLGVKGIIPRFAMWVILIIIVVLSLLFIIPGLFDY